jgi:hypothetical protein
VEDQRTACQESVKRVHDLEAMVALLRAQLSPEELASFDSGQTQATPGPSGSTQSPTVILIHPWIERSCLTHCSRTQIQTPTNVAT